MASRTSAPIAGECGRPRTVTRLTSRQNSGSTSGRTTMSARSTIEYCGMKAKPRPAATMARIQSSRSLRYTRSTFVPRWAKTSRATLTCSQLMRLTEANQIAERNHETWCNAMLELERGELLLLDAEAGGEADAAFKHAIDLAAGQGAKTLELRASVARARHCAERGEGQKALDMLSPIYGWFSQGFETPDLLQAKMLLGELR